MIATTPLQSAVAEPDSSVISAATRPATAPRAEVTDFDVRFAMLALAGEIVVVVLALLPAAPFALALLVHLIVIAGLAYAILQRRRAHADLSTPLLTLIAVSAAGPVGGFVSLAALGWLRRPAQPSERLQAWYDRIAMTTSVDSETQLADRVAAGRMIDTAARAPDALVHVIRNGSLGERQAALGLVARFFHMNYLAALADALRSDVPVIRVQAAAVASRIRPRLAEEIAHRLAEATSLGAAASTASKTDAAHLRQRLELIRDLDAAVASQLLDKPIEDAARRVAGELAASIDCLALPLARRETIEGRARLHALEARLIAAGEFQRLRMLDRRRRLAQRGFIRLRPWPQRRATGLARVSEAVEAGAST